MLQNKSEEGVKIFTPKAIQLFPLLDKLTAKDDIPDNTYPGIPFIDVKSQVVKVGIDQRDIIPTYHYRKHFVGPPREPKPKIEKGLLNLRLLNGASPNSS